MRGKGSEDSGGVKYTRITPAYAGKRHSLFHSTEVEQDHPRLCGEKPKPTPTTLTIMGSPPPMRGKVLVHMLLLQYHGITPAYAGKRSLGLTVYLHVSGSPPPMRGKD